jgi:hypothetical protein
MSEKRIKRKYFMCEEIYLSSQWHERVKQGWGTYKFDHSRQTVLMLKPKEDGINGNVIQIQMSKM